MAELGTKRNEESVGEFINSIEDAQKRKDCIEVSRIMREITGEEAKMWGDTIVGFGQYHYKYESGREGDWFIAGFSPRKQNLTLYIMAGFDRYEELMEHLGKHKTGKSCLYVKSLDDIDQEVLRELISSSVDHMRATYP